MVIWSSFGTVYSAILVDDMWVWAGQTGVGEWGACLTCLAPSCSMTVRVSFWDKVETGAISADVVEQRTDGSLVWKLSTLRAMISDAAFGNNCVGELDLKLQPKQATVIDFPVSFGSLAFSQRLLASPGPCGFSVKSKLCYKLAKNVAGRDKSQPRAAFLQLRYERLLLRIHPCISSTNIPFRTYLSELGRIGVPCSTKPPRFPWTSCLAAFGIVESWRPFWR